MYYMGFMVWSAVDDPPDLKQIAIVVLVSLRVVGTGSLWVALDNGRACVGAYIV